jgi:hypothetical protein
MILGPARRQYSRFRRRPTMISRAEMGIDTKVRLLGGNTFIRMEFMRPTTALQLTPTVDRPTLGSHRPSNDGKHFGLDRVCGLRPRFWPSLRRLWPGVALLLCAVAPGWAQESSDVAKQAQNPIANLISVPFENDFNPQTGIKKENSYVLQMKPVIPFRLSDGWTVITRTIIPLVQVPDLAPGVEGTTGLGDVNVSLFLSPVKAGPIIWGAGPIVSFPTATRDVLGTKKVSIGPTVVGLRSHGRWLYGVLVNNLFSIGGPSARADVNQMFMQPFANYNLHRGWYLVSSPIITANWELKSSDRWTLPLGGGVGKIVHVGKLPVNMYAQLFRNIERPDGTTHWSVRFQAQLLFPQHKESKR